MDWFRRWRWPLFVALLLAAGLAFAFWPEAIPVDTDRVSRGPMQVGVTDDGVTRAVDVFVVSAPVTGYLSRIELEPGDAVARGALVARMQARPAAPVDARSLAELRAGLASAQASASGMAAGLAQSRRDLARAEELAGRGFLARADLEAARTLVASGEALLAKAQAETARLRASLADASGQPSGLSVPVRAPAGGVVLTVLSESEGVIAEGAPLMTIGDPAAIEVVVDLLSREAVKVKPGAPVSITQWGGDEPIAATVRRIEPSGSLKVSALGIEEQRVNVIIGFPASAAPQVARLGHGYQLDATIVLWREEKALRVPLGALFRGADGNWQVLVVERGRASARVVRLGQVNDEYGQVLSGLAEGDLVVLNPSRSIADGSRVAPR